MTTLQTRLRALEDKLNPLTAIIPVFMVTMDTGNPSKPYSIDYDGETWMQEPEESLEDFKERAKTGALLHPVPKGKFPAIFLCAKRPSLTKEEWMELYGSGGSETWPGESN